MPSVTNSSVVYILASKTEMCPVPRNTSSDISVSDLDILKLADAEFIATKMESSIKIFSRVEVSKIWR
jgi:hypothetical protein